MPFTIEDFNTHISNLLKGGETAELSNIATELQDDYATTLAERQESEKKISELEEENKRLKDTNYELLLKRGIESKTTEESREIKKQENKEVNGMTVEEYLKKEGY